MKKVLFWISTSIFLLGFFIILLIFHPLQMLGKAIGYQWHKRVVDSMLWWINRSLLLNGTYVKYRRQNTTPIPTDRPLIIVSNHQSMFDIPAIGWMLRKNHPKYVAKKSLQYGIPSISYNIRNGGSVTIDRKDSRQALQALEDFGKYIQENKFAACIFPEGTRSRDGKLRPFKGLGLMKLLRTIPDALVVPVAVEGFWPIERYRLKPVPFAPNLRCTLLEPIERDLSDKEIVKLVEERIKAAAEANL